MDKGEGSIEGHPLKHTFMSGKFILRSRLDVYGAFWKPDSPDQKFTGRLARNQQGIELTSSPELRVVEGLPDFLNSEEETIEVLHGFTTDGPCTLFWLQSFMPAGITDFSTGQALRFRQFRVNLCVFGLHIPSASAPVLSSVRFSYSGLQEWISRRPGMEVTPDTIKLMHSRKLSPVFDVCSTAIKSRIVFDVVPQLELHSSGEYKSTNEPQLAVEPAEPQSVEWFLDLAYRFETFFSLWVGTSICLLSIAATYDGNTGWFVRQVRNKIKKTDPFVWVTCDSSQLLTAALRWLSTPGAFRPFENVVYGTIRNSSLFAETEFLSLAQALEAFHRLTDVAKVSAPESFNSIRQSLQKTIRDICGESEIASRLDECIQHANDVTFQQRVKSLLSRLSDNSCQRLLGNPDEFEQVLRQTRNYFTHPGIKKQSKVLTDAKKLFLFNQKLHALLRMLALIHLGLPEVLIFEPAYYQSRKWH